MLLLQASQNLRHRDTNALHARPRAEWRLRTRVRAGHPRADELAACALTKDVLNMSGFGIYGCSQANDIDSGYFLTWPWKSPQL